MNSTTVPTADPKLAPALAPRRVVLTGGPGSGKTASLELLRKTLCDHVAIVPESASILFRGGFPRAPSDEAKCAAQRAIFHVQLELERLAESERDLHLILCDRGTVDGAAYWPLSPDAFWHELGTSEAEQLRRYDAVIHLAPPHGRAYHRDAVRIESADESAVIDARITAAWSRHPRRYTIPSTPRFLDKVQQVLAIVEREMLCGCAAHANDPPTTTR